MDEGTDQTNDEGTPLTQGGAEVSSTDEVPSALQDALRARWNALGDEVFSGYLVDERRLSNLGRDCELIATVWTWFRTGGNITKAARRLHTSRRVLRERINVWRRRYPELIPDAEMKTSAAKGHGVEGDATNDERGLRSDEIRQTQQEPSDQDTP